MDIIEFLEQTEWAGASIEPMGADMGLRRYARLIKNGKRALFMDTSACGERESLNYFIEIAEYLRSIGVQTPEIYAQDLKLNCAIIEEMGQKSFGDKIKEGYAPEQTYKMATDALVTIQENSQSNDLDLSDYTQTVLRHNLCQFVEYYIPKVTSINPDENLLSSFNEVLNEIWDNLPPCPMGFCHADYHLENLMWYPQSDAGYGVIDFQDAIWGFKGYDLLNLLEDARQTVPADIKVEMRNLYCANMSVTEREVFDQWYALMSMHFHCRVIGLFIKFARESGGTEFLAHIPRLQGYITENLKNPIFKPLKDWLESHNIQFNQIIS